MDDALRALIEQVEVAPLAPQGAFALEGAIYPLARREVLVLARENEAPAMLLSLLSLLPDRSFGGEDEVQAALHEALERR
jgi:hypothetical protein